MKYRTDYVGSLTEKDVDREVILSGWVDRVRDHGGILFIDLRDREGILQIVSKEMHHLKQEYVIRVKGIVRRRGDESINASIPTGYIELEAKSIEVLNESLTLPFAINDEVNEMIKFKHRYLSLRSKAGIERIKKRSLLMKVMRTYLDNKGFLEIDTPVLTKATPEGARDFLIPSRMNRGKFYALPQSPQLFKQILVIGGVDKYYQIARCFRDEDMRADRQLEFVQLDIEAAFVDRDDVMQLAEGLMKEILSTFRNINLNKVDRLKHEEAMKKYGSDKPDRRFGLEIEDLTDIAENCEFKVFKDATKSGVVRGINAKDLNISRADIELLTEKIGKYGAKGLAWIKVGNTSGISKFFKQEELDAISRRLKADINDTLFFVADRREVVEQSLGFLRLELANMFNLIDKDKIDVLWVTDFPLFEWSETENRFLSAHHPFTAPQNDDISDMKNTLAKAYDLVVNGFEIAGGSIRINKVEMQRKIFDLLGVQDAEEKFIHLMNALSYGAPPHGGIAFGFDRLLAVLMGDNSIRDVIPFPKTQKGLCPLTDAPADVYDKDLEELGIKRGRIV